MAALGLKRLRKAVSLLLVSALLSSGGLPPRGAAAASPRSAPLLARASWAQGFHNVFFKADPGAFRKTFVHGVGLEAEFPRLREIYLFSGREETAMRPVLRRLEEFYPSPEIFLALPESDQRTVLLEAAAFAVATARAEARRLVRQVEGGFMPEERINALHEALSRLVKDGLYDHLRPKDQDRVRESRRRIADRIEAVRLRKAHKIVVATGRAWQRSGGQGTPGTESAGVPAGEPQAAPSGLSPAAAALSPGQLESLRSLLLKDGPDALFTPSGFKSVSELLDHIDDGPRTRRLHSPSGFRALMEGDPAETRVLLEDLRSPDMMKATLNLMYYSVVRVARSGLPDSERRPLVDALARRYSALLRRIWSEHGLPPEVREAAGRSRSQLLESGALVDVLDREREARAMAADIRGLAETLRGRGIVAGLSERGPPAERPWEVPEPSPVEGRARGEARERVVDSLDALMAELATTQARLARLVKQRADTKPDGPQARTLAKALEEARSELEKLLPSVDWLEMIVSRFAWVTMAMNFVDIRILPVISIPEHPALRLIPEPGGFLIRAGFETDIRDERVLGYVRASIEEYWRGEFEHRGRRLRLRTEVAIRRLGPGEGFSGRALRLVDGKDGMTHAAHDQLVLGRDPRYLHWAMPAHEFGHLLGLGDEYFERFDARRRARIDVLVPGSLMGGSDGSTLPRHLRMAVLLLAQRSLEPRGWGGLLRSWASAPFAFLRRLLGGSA